MPEMLRIIRDCDELKRRDYFTEAARAELARPMAEHVLERAADGGWELRPLKFGPAHVVDAARADRSRWTYANPHAAQTPWLRIRAPLGPGAFRSEGEHRAGRAEGRRGTEGRRFGVGRSAANRRAVARENARRWPGMLLLGRESRKGAFRLVPAHARTAQAGGFDSAPAARVLDSHPGKRRHP